MVRKVMAPRNGYEDWEITQLIANALGLGWKYTHPSEVMDEVAAHHAELCRRVVRQARPARVGAMAVQRSGARGHADDACRSFRARQGQFPDHRIYRRRDERTGPRFPLLLTTGRILSQYNVGAQTRRTANIVWHQEDCWKFIPTTPRSAASATAIGCGWRAGRGDEAAGAYH